MREMDKDGLLLCSIQGRIFEESNAKYATSSPVFIRRFMNSELAREIDSGGLLERPFNEEDGFARLDEEFGTSSYGTEKYPTEVLYWIGYIYRYWSYVYEWPSRRVYRAAGARELRDLYYAYHTLDPLNAIQRIMEAKRLITGPGEYSIEEGVQLLREVREKMAEYHPIVNVTKKTLSMIK